MLAFVIDRGDRFRKGHAALLSDLFQTVPELVFKANARLVACNDNRALRNQRLHGFRSRLLSRPATSNVSRLPPPNRTRILTWRGQTPSEERTCPLRHLAPQQLAALSPRLL